MRSIRYSPALLAWLLLLAACSPQQEPGAAEADEASAEATATSEDEAAEEDSTPKIPVEASYPDRGDVYAMYSGTAAIEALAEADVIAKVGGQIVEIVAEEGDVVEEGDVLARLDGDRLALELDESRARLEKLRNDFNRNIELKERGLISDGDFDKLKFDLEALEAAFNLARLELDYTIVRAPIDGVISRRIARRGNTVSEGDVLYRVTSFDPLAAYMFVPEREYQRIDPGKPVAIQVDALGDTPIAASVTRVSPVVDPETGTFKITIEIDGSDLRIKPGMFARIGIVYETRENALRIPRSALLDSEEGNAVYVIEDGRANRRAVETGYSDRGMIEIVSGLDDGELVVTVGQSGLKEGAAVSVINGPALPSQQVPNDAKPD